MSPRPVTIFLSAAEASGDEHAANLMRAIRAVLPEARFVGVAGERMAAEGCEVLADLTKKAAMLGGPLLSLGYYFRAVRRLQKAIRSIRPDLHIPVDSPALNWHLAAAARKAGTPVLYYIAPQVWAWGPWRVKKLARLTDRVACILPFEEDYLRRRGVHATFVGHPIFDGHPQRPPAPPDLADAWFSGAWQVALLPGSRPGELASHTAPLLEVADAIVRRWPKARCVFATLEQAGARRVQDACRSPRRLADGGRSPRGAPGPCRPVDVVVGQTAALEVLSRSHFAVAASGTVTLQAAYYGVPMVIFYKASPFIRALFHTVGRSRGVVGTPHLALVNILAGRRVVPELMPWRGNRPPLIRMTLDVMSDLGHLTEMRQNVLRLVEPLHVPPPGTAAANAAAIALELLRR